MPVAIFKSTDIALDEYDFENHEDPDLLVAFSIKPDSESISNYFQAALARIIDSIPSGPWDELASALNEVFDWEFDGHTLRGRR